MDELPPTYVREHGQDRHSVRFGWALGGFGAADESVATFTVDVVETELSPVDIINYKFLPKFEKKCQLNGIIVWGPGNEEEEVLEEIRRVDSPEHWPLQINDTYFYFDVHRKIERIDTCLQLLLRHPPLRIAFLSVLLLIAQIYIITGCIRRM